ncbi:MAG: FG-GAP repeat protein [Phycisphaeraceae bacterium]|nr:FG-GAP repeat protein [Phycisphaeraceae bacterium]
MALLSLAVGTAAAQTEEHKILASDGFDGDLFGKAVAIDGSVVVVGAHFNGDNGALSGSAYIFDVETGQELFKLNPSNNSGGDNFGIAVDVSGTIAVIGASGDDDNGFDSGSAYLFDVTTGMELHKLVPADGVAGSFFGSSVAIDGAYVVIGCRRDDDNGVFSGSVYVYDAMTGMFLRKLLALDGVDADFFGTSVAIDGVTVAVGAEGDDDNGDASGSAYIFDVTSGMQLHKLLPDNGQAGEFFGSSVAIDSGVVVVGADNSNRYGDNSGSAYTYSVASGAQLHELLRGDGGSVGDFFGESVSISGDTIAVGCRNDDDFGMNSGSAYLFRALTGQQTSKLLAENDAVAEDEFGNAVAVQGDRVVVGAWKVSDAGPDAGAVYLFGPGCVLPGDLNADGLVDTSDLGILLGGFGDACP